MIAVAIQGYRLPTIEKGESLSLTIIKVGYPCLPLLLAQLSSETLLRSHRGSHLCTLYDEHHEHKATTEHQKMVGSKIEYIKN